LIPLVAAGEKGQPTHAYHRYQPRKPSHVPRWFHQHLVVQHTAIVCSKERAIAVFPLRKLVSQTVFALANSGLRLRSGSGEIFLSGARERDIRVAASAFLEIQNPVSRGDVYSPVNIKWNALMAEHGLLLRNLNESCMLTSIVPCTFEL